MYTKEKQGVLNIYIEGFKPALRHAFVGGVESVYSVLNDFDGFQWKDFFQWKVESGKWKVCINELNAKHPSLSPLSRTLPSEKCPVDSSRERNRGVSTIHNQKTNTTQDEYNFTQSPAHMLTCSLEPTPTRIRKLRLHSATAAPSLLRAVVRPNNTNSILSF